MIEVNNDILNKSINNNRLSHAYLFETDYDNDNLEYIYEFIKNIFYKNKSEEEKKVISKRIDDNNFTELKVIKRDGQTIKKEQIIELQKEFSVTSQESDVRIYVIFEAEKMNPSSANTLLKFLEEPAGNIIGILLTNNIHSVISTLVSRCQIISLQKSKTISLSANYNLITQFLYDINTNKLDIYANIKTYEILFSSKEAIEDTLKNIIIIFSDIIYSKINNSYQYIIHNNEIEMIAQKNTIESLTNKINIINDLLESIKYNLNIQLVIDKIIILMCGVDNSDSTSKN